jgi:hypothetical protein
MRLMRILDIRETAIPLKSELTNSSFDFTEMTTSVVAVITDVIRGGRPVTGFAFNSTGRYACGAQMRARFIPRILAAKPETLLDATGENIDPAKVLAVMLQREKSGGHSERSIAIGTIEVALWDAVPRSPRSHCIEFLPSATTAARCQSACSATSAAAGICRARPSATCRTRCCGISMPATPW